MAGAAGSFRPRHWADEIQACDTATTRQEDTELKSRAQFSLGGSSAGRGAGLQRAEIGEKFSRLAPCLSLLCHVAKSRARPGCWHCAERAADVPIKVCASLTTCWAKAVSSMVPLTKRAEAAPSSRQRCTTCRQHGQSPSLPWEPPVPSRVGV